MLQLGRLFGDEEPEAIARENTKSCRRELPMTGPTVTARERECAICEPGLARILRSLRR